MADKMRPRQTQFTCFIYDLKDNVYALEYAHDASSITPKV
jgi:hypothetical protein